MFLELLILVILIYGFGKLFYPSSQKEKMGLDLNSGYNTYDGGFVSDTELYYRGRQGRPYGVNNLYRSDTSTVRIPSKFNEMMEACANKCFNGVRYIQPRNFLNVHGPIPTEARWCLDECMADSTEPYFD